MNAQQLKNFGRSTLVARRTITQELAMLDATVDFITQAVSSGIPSWTDALIFNTTGTGAGPFCTYPDVNNHLRFWKSKVDGNINHQPSTNPLITEDTYWLEVSPSDGSAIKEWTPGIYPSGLVIIYFDINGDGTGMNLFKLTEASRPFTSSNFLTELAAGSWAPINGEARFSLDTSINPVLNCNHFKRLIFVGNTSINVARSWSLSNEDTAEKISSFFTMSASGAGKEQTFPDNVKYKSGGEGSGDWGLVSGHPTWTPPGNGDYEAELKFNGANWLITINGPF